MLSITPDTPPFPFLCIVQVREMAARAGLSVADKKDSTGICFVGKRKFGDFIEQCVYWREGGKGIWMSLFPIS